MTTDAPLGVLGKFDALLPPSIEVYVLDPNDGQTTLEQFEGYLRIIRLA